jgi:hypothetical protein
MARKLSPKVIDPAATPAEVEVVPEVEAKPATPAVDGIDVDVLAEILVERCLAVLRGQEDRRDNGELKKRLFDAEQAEKAAKARAVEAESQADTFADALAESKARMAGLKNELAEVRRLNKVLMKKLEVADWWRGLGHPLRDLISIDETDAIEHLRRELAQVMVQPRTKG